jgi:hypothetical protein
VLVLVSWAGRHSSQKRDFSNAVILALQPLWLRQALSTLYQDSTQMIRFLFGMLYFIARQGLGFRVEGKLLLAVGEVMAGAHPHNLFEYDEEIPLSTQKSYEYLRKAIRAYYDSDSEAPPAEYGNDFLEELLQNKFCHHLANAGFHMDAFLPFFQSSRGRQVIQEKLRMVPQAFRQSGMEGIAQACVFTLSLGTMKSYVEAWTLERQQWYCEGRLACLQGAWFGQGEITLLEQEITRIREEQRSALFGMGAVPQEGVLADIPFSLVKKHSAWDLLTVAQKEDYVAQHEGHCVSEIAQCETQQWSLDARQKLEVLKYELMEIRLARAELPQALATNLANTLFATAFRSALAEVAQEKKKYGQVFEVSYPDEEL